MTKSTLQDGLKQAQPPFLNHCPSITYGARSSLVEGASRRHQLSADRVHICATSSARRHPRFAMPSSHQHTDDAPNQSTGNCADRHRTLTTTNVAYATKRIFARRIGR